MKYQNAAEVLPEELLKTIQEYFQGGLLYIPGTDEKTKWGSINGAREYYEQRNRQIREAYKENVSMKDLAKQFGLAENTIKKILYQ